jgi:hypothetical protein
LAGGGSGAVEAAACAAFAGAPALVGAGGSASREQPVKARLASDASNREETSRAGKGAPVICMGHGRWEWRRC